MKLDILAFGAHPDDVELSAAGTLIHHIKKGYKCGIVDLTRGELGTRGTPEIRESEAKKATEIMGVHIRECLNLDDGFFENNKVSQLAVASMIRKYKPEIVLSNAIADRHPDHPRSASLVTVAVFIAGLQQVKTFHDNVEQERWQVKSHYHYIQDRYVKPDFAVDITAEWEKKMESVMAFSSQFYNPKSKEPATAISGQDFIKFLEGRAVETGRQIGVAYAEGFTVERTPGVTDLFNLL